MKLYFYGFIAIIKKFIFKRNTGEVINWFVRKMGIVYIKFAQILATYNLGTIFTEEDRKNLCSICDDCEQIKFKKIEKIIEDEYQCDISQKFNKIYPDPIGTASVSQVHKAILKNGDVVAIKVKRKDITKKIDRDIKQIKKLTHRYGKLFGINNLLGSDKILEMYLGWIYEECDFKNEVTNIKNYKIFADNVNGKLENTKKIVLPKVYKKMCTDNIIVMEYIDSWTINKLKLTNKNKEKIKAALNDYVKLSFYSLINNDELTFHGDPHSGNIYIDKEGNVGFLDFGLTFSFTLEESKYIKELFFKAYFNKYEDVADMILDRSKSKDLDRESLTFEIGECCNEFKDIPVSNFFINMMLIFIKYDVAPPEVFFKLVKTFVAVNGLNDLIDNSMDTEKLLIEQITEYYVNRTFEDVEDIIKSGINILPNLVKNTLTKGLVKGISEEIVSINELHKKVTKTLENYNEVASYFKNV